MQVYVSFDGDHIGRVVGQARLSDDVEQVRRTSQAIDHGNDIWRSFALSAGGSVVDLGGDEGAIEIPADKLEDLPRIREQYQTAVEASVSVGVGMKLSESAKALLAAKLQGGDKIVFYSPVVEEILKEAEAKKPDETEKIVDAYLNKGEVVKFPGNPKPAQDKGVEAPVQELHPAEPESTGISDNEAGEIADDLLMSPAAHAANKQSLLEQKAHTRKVAGFRSFNPGDTVEHTTNGREGKVVSHEGPVRMPDGKTAKHVYGVQIAGQRGVTHLFEDELRLKKDEGSGGSVGGFTGHRVAAPSKAMSPESQQSQHSEAQDVYNTMGEERPPGPEATHAAQDLEEQFHAAAQEQSQKDDNQPDPPQIDAVKSKVAQILQQVKSQAPILEQIKQSAPQTYQAVIDMTQAVIAMAKELPKSGQGPLAKAERSKGVELVHFSTTPGLKVVGVDKMGTGTRSEEYKQGMPAVPRAYYYTAGTKPEHLVTQGAKAQYKAVLDSHKHRLYDLGKDVEGLKQKAQDKYLSGEGGESPQDAFLQSVKEKGYYGYHNGSMPGVVALFYPHPVQEVGMGKAEKEPEPKRDLANTLTGEVREALSQKRQDRVADDYAGAEALHELLGGEHAGWQPMHVKHEGGPHWFLLHRTTGRILDPTSDQFRTPVPYEKAIPKGFIQYRNAEGRLVPSKRAQEVISRVLSDQSMEKGELETGTRTEMEEHGMSADKARKTAKDHLREDPKYYTKMKECLGKTGKRELEPNEPAPPSGVLDKDIEKGATMNGLPLPKSPKKIERRPLPVGTTIEGQGKFKVQHSDGSESWKSGRAGVIRSQDPSEHATSSREPGAR